MVVGPAFWEIHDFPAGYWRPMPDFFIEFARQQECQIEPDCFKRIIGSQSLDRILVDVTTTIGDDYPNQKAFPSRRHDPQFYDANRWLRTRVVERLIKTASHDWWFPRAALGVIMICP